MLHESQRSPPAPDGLRQIEKWHARIAVMLDVVVAILRREQDSFDQAKRVGAENLVFAGTLDGRMLRQHPHPVKSDQARQQRYYSVEEKKREHLKIDY
jgi:hypothetical protein